MRIDHARLWTIVPVRGFAAGKSRLAPVLGPAGRAALNRMLLAHTLGVLGDWDGALTRCIVVSPSMPALRYARDAGAVPLYEGTDAVGLNAAVELGLARVRTRGATHALVLAGDLPYLGVEALAEIERVARRTRGIALAADRSGTGTNALLIGVGMKFTVAFGPHSLAAHRLAAERAALEVSVVRRKELEFDLDLPEDLAAWRRGRGRRGVTFSRAHGGRRFAFPRRGRRATMCTNIFQRDEEGS